MEAMINGTMKFEITREIPSMQVDLSNYDAGREAFANMMQQIAHARALNGTPNGMFHVSVSFESDSEE